MTDDVVESENMAFGSLLSSPPFNVRSLMVCADVYSQVPSMSHRTIADVAVEHGFLIDSL